MAVAIILFVFIVIVAIAGAVGLIAHMRSLASTEKTARLTFDWKYILLPLSLLAVSVILSMFFYAQLPEQVAYHFSGGQPDRWLSRPLAMVWVLAPQLLLTLLAAGIVWGVTRVNILPQAEAAGIRPEAVLMFMGNVVAVPQLIAAFAMLDVFSYNAYRVHVPVVVSLFVVLGLGTVALGVFFARVISRANRQQLS